MHYKQDPDKIRKNFVPDSEKKHSLSKLRPKLSAWLRPNHGSLGLSALIRPKIQ